MHPDWRERRKTNHGCEYLKAQVLSPDDHRAAAAAGVQRGFQRGTHASQAHIREQALGVPSKNPRDGGLRPVWCSREEESEGNQKERGLTGPGTNEPVRCIIHEPPHARGSPRGSLKGEEQRQEEGMGRKALQALRVQHAQRGHGRVTTTRKRKRARERMCVRVCMCLCVCMTCPCHLKKKKREREREGGRERYEQVCFCME